MMLKRKREKAVPIPPTPAEPGLGGLGEEKQPEPPRPQGGEVQIPKPHLKRQAFHQEKLAQWMAENNFKKRNAELEDDRCQADLLYALFHRPQTVADRLLQGLMDLIVRRNDPDLERSRMFRESHQYVTQHPRAAWVLKVFNILLILSREPGAAEVFEAGYDPDSPGCLWGHNYKDHLQRFLQNLRFMVDGTMSCSFGECNIVFIVQRFVQDAEMTYLTK